ARVAPGLGSSCLLDIPATVGLAGETRLTRTGRHVVLYIRGTLVVRSCPSSSPMSILIRGRQRLLAGSCVRVTSEAQAFVSWGRRPVTRFNVFVRCWRWSRRA